MKLVRAVSPDDIRCSVGLRPPSLWPCHLTGMERSGSASLTGQGNESCAPESAMRNLVSNCASSQAFRLQVRPSGRPPGWFNEDVGAHQSHVA